ncbi:hypothetical protein MUN89_04835 [Halobacillus salinarum]|uniref:Polyhydroxyalkanoate synthesis regulator phasin n=1 Tax=Halobacillus salinarum TaxID=2932257 RepID=A0ABY4ELE0_9BACI|nr:hypothetical protein [Halobacillus salinarum]UOQ45277.1 hypothetical protein MUN89_04835 [Halobacillus salinarum]
MSELLKKGFYLGLGAAVSGKEKFEKMVNDMVSKGEMTPSQAKSIINTWISKGESVDKDWNGQAKSKLQNRMKSLGFVTREEYETLEARIEKLENRP